MIPPAPDSAPSPGPALAQKRPLPLPPGKGPIAGRRWWLVGGTEGLGLALARQMSALGADLVLSGRDEVRLAQAIASLPGPARALPMDIGDPASVLRAAQELGECDGLVFLAALYWPMRADQLAPDQFLTMCDVNFTGCARVLAQVLPGMLAKGAGHIVLTGSLAGYRGLPGAMGYGASKAGVIGLAESLHADLRKSGIKVQLANPGFIRTRLTAKNDFAMPFLMEPDEAARQMLRLMHSRRFSAAFPAAFASLFRLGRLLPDWAYYRLFA